MKERITSVQTSLLAIAKKAQSDAITLVLLRKRVFTKSPVRENRTPGSVRGLSGNRQSYRAHFCSSPTTECAVSFFTFVKYSRLQPDLLRWKYERCLDELRRSVISNP